MSEYPFTYPQGLLTTEDEHVTHSAAELITMTDIHFLNEGACCGCSDGSKETCIGSYTGKAGTSGIVALSSKSSWSRVVEEAVDIAHSDWNGAVCNQKGCCG